MNKMFTKFRTTKYKTLPILIFFFIFIASCSTAIRESGNSLDATLGIQNTRIAVLETQIADQTQKDGFQWDAISYLSTQMPFALELITPLPPGVTITPTPYSLDVQEGPTFTPTPWIDIEYPPGTRTGIAEIDLVIDAVMFQDANARIDLIRYTTSACTTADGFGGPPKCEPGEIKDTPVDAFPVLNSEGFQVRPDEIREVFDFTVRGLLAVYRVPEDAYETDYWPAGEYGLVFTSEDDQYPHVIVILVEDGHIVRLEFNVGWPPFDLIWDKSDEFILPPSTRGQLTTTPVCTPPACAPDEVYHCPSACPGGCGTTCATVTPGIASGTGQVWGEICYPGDANPPMTIYFHEIRTLELYSLQISENQNSYEIDLPVGIYNAFSWLLDRSSAGGYSEYLICGGRDDCTDHTLVPFLVDVNRVTTGVDICDWGGFTDLFPDVPEP
jgi:hypothetical protein